VYAVKEGRKDMALLNPIKQKEAGERVAGYSKELSEFTKQCKAMVEGRRAISPVQVEKTTDLIEKLARYEEDTLRQGKPLTMAGYILASELKHDTFYRVLNGDYDYVVEEYRLLHDVPADVIEYTDDEGTVQLLIAWSDILQNCRLKIQQQLEENCYNSSTHRGLNPAGSIFGLKAQHGWKEDNAATHNTTNNNLIIADATQALKALKSLE
jgi:hypothetical protein